LTLDGDPFHIDLVFYHTVLKCYVITDNKTLKGLAASCTHRGEEQTGK